MILERRRLTMTHEERITLLPFNNRSGMARAAVGQACQRSNGQLQAGSASSGSSNLPPFGHGCRGAGPGGPGREHYRSGVSAVARSRFGNPVRHFGRSEYDRAQLHGDRPGGIRLPDTVPGSRFSGYAVSQRQHGHVGVPAAAEIAARLRFTFTGRGE